MNKIFKITLPSIILLITIYSAFAAVIDMMAFEANIFDNKGDKR